MRLPEHGPKNVEPKHVATIKTNVSSSIGLFVLLCWRPNATDNKMEDNTETGLNNNITVGIADWRLCQITVTKKY
jgi:hypothetical protein